MTITFEPPVITGEPARRCAGAATPGNNDPRVRQRPLRDARHASPRGDGQHPAAPRRRRNRTVPRPPGTAQLLPRTGQGRPALLARCHAGRGTGPGDVDDVEMRAARRAVRRRQGRRPYRPPGLQHRRTRAGDPPLHQRDQSADRSRARHSRPRHRHGRADHGLADGYLLGAAGPHRPGRRHRQAGQPGRLARPRSRHVARRRARCAGGNAVARDPDRRSHRRRAGLRQGRPLCRTVPDRRPACESSPSPTSTARSRRTWAWTSPHSRNTSMRPARWSASTPATRSPTPNCSRPMSICWCRPPSRASSTPATPTASVPR